MDAERLVRRDQEQRSPNEGPKKKSFELYSVSQNPDGTFEAILPGLYDYNRGQIVGFDIRTFATQEEAEAAAEEAQRDAKEFSERSSLAKGFTEHSYKINKTDDGKYKVTLPGLKSERTGFLVGTTTFEFETWDEAREFYLQHLEDESRITGQPILELRVGDQEQMAFSDFDAFKPKVAPSDTAKAIPEATAKYIAQREEKAQTDSNTATYQNTTKERGWEQNLYNFVSSYLTRERQDLLDELNIKRLDLLTPRQAVELSTRVVVELTKYKWSDAGRTETTPTQADQRTALDLLQEGARMKDKEDWEGNGICRNFASMTKAVFEALKAKQTRFNYLRDTYCLYEGGDSSLFDPEKEDWTTTKKRDGHAWNTFVTVSETQANATIVDTTWAKQNLETGQVEGLDYTLTRMEPVVHQMALELQADAPDHHEQLQQILEYYRFKMETGTQSVGSETPVGQLDDERKTFYRDLAVHQFSDKYDLSGSTDEELIALGQSFAREYGRALKQKRENDFYSSRVLEILKQQREVPEIPQPIVEAIGRTYLETAETADSAEIETLFRIDKTSAGIPFAKILRKYLDAKPLNVYHQHRYVTSNPELQKRIYDEIKKHDNFDALLNDGIKFRVSLRDALPQLFQEFDPGSNQADAKELRHLMNDQGIPYERLLKPERMTPDKVEVVFQKVREGLMALNREKFVQMFGTTSDHDLVRNYRKISIQLKE